MTNLKTSKYYKRKADRALADSNRLLKRVAMDILVDLTDEINKASENGCKRTTIKLPLNLGNNMKLLELERGILVSILNQPLHKRGFSTETDECLKFFTISWDN